MTSRTRPELPIWWGRYELGRGHWGCWRIGPLWLWLLHGEMEWRLLYRQDDDAHDIDLAVHVPSDPPPADPHLELIRFSGDQADAPLFLTPAVADRPVVSYPDHPFYIPEGRDATLYISSPVWLRIAAGREDGVLRELPCYRPSDTWFGPSTCEGELCYASQTRARLELEDLPVRPHRATTPVHIKNVGEEPLLLERLNLPVPYLSLYAGTDGKLWTETVTLERHSGGQLTELKLGRGAPRGVKATLVAGPRERARPNVMVRAFTALFR